jgi:hypothetical protein
MKIKFCLVLLASFVCLLSNAQKDQPINGGLENSKAGDTTAANWLFESTSGKVKLHIVDSVKHLENNSLFLDLMTKYTNNFRDIQIANQPILSEREIYYSFYRYSL